MYAYETQDTVYELVHSMTKSEKRSFRIFAERLNSGRDIKFLSLFDAMENASEYDELKLQKRSGVSAEQFANTKSYLLRQLLVSLRYGAAKIYDDIALHEQMDFARILYSKRMYRQSLKLLEKIKTQAQQKMQTTIAFEITEFEKMIEFNCHLDWERSKILTDSAQDLLRNMNAINHYSNLALQLQTFYIARGHIRNQNDINYVEDRFLEHLRKIEKPQQNVYERLYKNLANYWYSFIRQEFAQCCKYAQLNMALFDENPALKNHLLELYFKHFNYLLKNMLYLRQYQRYRETLAALEESLHTPDISDILNDNAKISARIYYFTGKINLHFLEGTFTEGLSALNPLHSFLETHSTKIEPRCIMMFYYKAACLHFGSGRYEPCIALLNKIINTSAEISPNLLCFSHILRLIATYDSGDRETTKYCLKSAHAFIASMRSANAIQKDILAFLNRISTPLTQDIIDVFKELHFRLLSYEAHPYEKQFLSWLDMISWLESKIHNTEVQKIIRNKFLRQN